MAETTDSLKQSPAQTRPLDTQTVRDALLRPRQLAAQLPPIDAAAVIRGIREGGSRTT